MKQEQTRNSDEVLNRIAEVEPFKAEGENQIEGTYLVCNDELFWKELKIMAEDSSHHKE